MELNRIKNLIKKYQEGTISPQEFEVLEAWYNSLNIQQGIEDNMLPDEALETRMYRQFQQKVQRQAELAQTQNKVAKVERLIPGWLAVAASVALFVVIGLVYLLKRTPDKQTPLALLPEFGQQHVTLTISNGSIFKIAEMPEGAATEDGSYKIIKQNKTLIYKGANTATEKADTKAWNKISTPRGAETEVVLPDGSHVWLNAGSSIKFPLAFQQQGREIELTGEAYFEVARVTSPNNKRIPFIVFTGAQRVEVLGTHFNIKAYANEEAIKTTLLEGSVRVSNSNTNTKVKHVLLVPGQEASFDTNQQLGITIADVNVDDAIAWHNNRFSFNNRSLTSIMRELERWYNVQVQYTQLPDKKFNGSIPRNIELAKVLRVLEKTSGYKLTINSFYNAEGKAERRLVMSK